MDLRFMDGAGNYPHRFGKGSIAADLSEVTTAADQHFVPSEHCIVCERFGIGAKQVDHHFGDSALGWRDAMVFRGKAELAADRRLDACAVENFAFDLGGGDRFGAHRLDGELLQVFGAEVLDGTAQGAGADQEGLFSLFKAV